MAAAVTLALLFQPLHVFIDPALPFVLRFRIGSQRKGDTGARTDGKPTEPWQGPAPPGSRAAAPLALRTIEPGRRIERRHAPRMTSAMPQDLRFAERRAAES
jgi:hypothetical protein